MPSDDRRRATPTDELAAHRDDEPDRPQETDELRREGLELLRRDGAAWQEIEAILAAAGLNPAHWRHYAQTWSEHAFAQACAARGARSLFWDAVEQEGFDLPPMSLDADGKLHWAREDEWPAATDRSEEEAGFPVQPMGIRRATEGEGTGLFTPDGVELTEAEADEWCARIAGDLPRSPLPGDAPAVTEFLHRGSAPVAVRSEAPVANAPGDRHAIAPPRTSANVKVAAERDQRSRRSTRAVWILLGVALVSALLTWNAASSSAPPNAQGLAATRSIEVPEEFRRRVFDSGPTLKTSEIAAYYRARGLSETEARQAARQVALQLVAEGATLESASRSGGAEPATP